MIVIGMCLIIKINFLIFYFIINFLIEMKLTIISLFLLFWVCQSTFMESASVVILDDSNFNEFIQLNHPTMVFFYTPGCGPWYFDI